MGRVKLTDRDIEEIIDLYQTTIPSTHKLAKQFKVGHKKISSILKENNITINKKGGQIIKTKVIDKPIFEEIDSKGEVHLKCIKTNKLFKDINNVSGVLTKHLKSLGLDINYYKFRGSNDPYFIIEVKEYQVLTHCKLCNWSTTDMDNKSGSFMKHLKNEHGMSPEEYLEMFPGSYDFNTTTKERVEYLNNEDNSVECKECGLPFKEITNTHLKNKHGITMFEYKLKYPLARITSKTTSEKLRVNMLEVNKTLKPKWTSSGELSISDFITSLGFKTSKSRSLLKGQEVDIVIDGTNLCIEYNGLYYHTDRMGKGSTYHLDKTKNCNNVGYSLIHVFEDEWVTKESIVKSKLRRLLKIPPKFKIGGRQVKIVKIGRENKRDFLNLYHIQGDDSSDIFYGAYFNKILVGVMTFSTKRNMTKNTINQFELSRFATKDDYSIYGLGSKFIKRVTNEYDIDSIISFADRRWTLNHLDNLYVKLGFELTNVLKPDYKYYNCSINKYKRYHKFGFGKNKLLTKYPTLLNSDMTEGEMSKTLGYDKIWDCGLLKYELKIKKSED